MCAHAVRVAVQEIPGVESVDVSLNRGLAVIRLARENRVSVEQLRDAIRDNGFTPKGAEVRVAGKVVERDGRPALAIPGQEIPFLLADHPDGEGKTEELLRVAGDGTVLVEGRVSAGKSTVERPPVLEIRAFWEMK